MDDPLFLAIDQGGHASRALIFDRRGGIVASASVDIATNRIGTDRVEHDAEELIDSVSRAIADATARIGSRAARVAAAGLATQRSSIVCWDRQTGAALSPVISWQDRRAAGWLAQFNAREAHIHDATGLVLSPHYGASKLRWCLDHLDAVRVARQGGRLACGPLASFILCRLLRGRPLLVDPANASRTQLWDLRRRDWSPELLELFGIPVDALPRCVPSRHGYGALDLPDRPVALEACTGDQSAALFAFGAPRGDTVYINAGTGAFLQRVVGAQPVPSGRLLSSVAWQDDAGATYVLEGTVNGAAGALREVGLELGIGESDLDASVVRALDSVADPPLFLNGVAGLGSPFWRADFKSRFVGAGDAERRLAAVAESIVFLIRANLDEIARLSGSPRRIVITGGLSGVDGLCRRLAALSGIPVDRPAAREATCRGLAWLLSGGPSGWSARPEEQRFDPAPDAALAARYARWRTAIG